MTSFLNTFGFGVVIASLLLLLVTPSLAQSDPQKDLSPPQIDPPQIGLLSAECVVTIDLPIDVPATGDGDDPFEIPSNVVFTMNAINRANRFHCHWLPPVGFDDALKIINFELTISTLDGVEVHQETVSPDVRQGGAPGNNFHMPVDAADADDILVVRIVTIFEDLDGNEIRSQPAFYPPTSLACCPGGHPPPKVLPAIINREESNSELDGGVYQVTSGNLPFTYFCNEGIYKSCYIIPEGFTDPNDERYQEIGGVAVFQDQNGNDVTFQCIFNPEGNGGETVVANDVTDLVSGRFIDISSDSIDLTPVSESSTRLNDPYLPLQLMIAGLILGFVSLGATCIYLQRRKNITDAANREQHRSAVRNHETGSELPPTDYEELSQQSQTA